VSPQKSFVNAEAAPDMIKNNFFSRKTAQIIVKICKKIKAILL
jgi:hypothetical protein